MAISLMITAGVLNRFQAGIKKKISMPDAMFEFFDLYLIEDLKKKELYLSTSEHFHTLEEYKTEIMQDIFNTCL